MLQRGYIILIIGGALLISGIVISALWAESFAGPFIRENTILNGVSIRPSGLINTTIQVSDTSRPVSLAIHVERNNNASGNGGNGLGGEEQIPNNTPKYDSFFLKNEEGKVKELWGVFGRYPYSTTYAYRIIHTCK